MKNAPIGIFDSGLGGLTVARAILDVIPEEDIIYLGDTANIPYGPRRLEEVRELVLTNLDYLAARGVKMIVIACNTATAAALGDAKERYERGMGIPIVEVVTPAATEAAERTGNKNVGVIGTAGTVGSGVYVDTLRAIPEVNVHQSACPRFVEFVEDGVTGGEELLSVAREYLDPLKDANVDTVVLGCTHYPLLEDVIGEVMGEGTTLVSSSDATAKETLRVLIEENLLHSVRPAGEGPEYRFLSTNLNGKFEELSKRFLGPEATHFEAVDVRQSLTV